MFHTHCWYIKLDVCRGFLCTRHDGNQMSIYHIEATEFIPFVFFFFFFFFFLAPPTKRKKFKWDTWGKRLGHPRLIRPLRHLFQRHAHCLYRISMFSSGKRVPLMTHICMISVSFFLSHVGWPTRAYLDSKIAGVIALHIVGSPVQAVMIFRLAYRKEIMLSILMIQFLWGIGKKMKNWI